MIEKGIATFNLVLVEFLSFTVPMTLASIIDIFTLPVRLVLALFIGA